MPSPNPTTNDKPEARDFYIGDEVRLAFPFTGKGVVKIEWGCRGFIYYTPPTSIGGHALPSPAGAWEHLDGAPLGRFVGIRTPDNPLESVALFSSCSQSATWEVGFHNGLAWVNQIIGTEEETL